MSEKNEIVVLNQTKEFRWELAYTLKHLLIQKGHAFVTDSDNRITYRFFDFTSFGLGFDFPERWPFEGEVTLHQLVVLAKKFGIQIKISGIEMHPMEIPAAEPVKAGQD